MHIDHVEDHMDIATKISNRQKKTYIKNLLGSFTRTNGRGRQNKFALRWTFIRNICIKSGLNFRSWNF